MSLQVGYSQADDIFSWPLLKGPMAPTMLKVTAGPP